MKEFFLDFVLSIDIQYDVAISLVAWCPAAYQKNSERARDGQTALEHNGH